MQDCALPLNYALRLNRALGFSQCSFDSAFDGDHRLLFWWR